MPFVHFSLQTIKCFCCVLYEFFIQSPVVWLAGHLSVSHEVDSNLNMSPKMSYGELVCGIMLQNYMLMIL